MFIDARRLADETTLRVDVCIVGAGPAGIVLARELERDGLRICLVESGGDGPSATPYEALPLAQLDGDIQPDWTTRAHGVGGTAHRWNLALPRHQVGVRYAPLRPIDFEVREGVTHSGWPFPRAHLAPYYARAHIACGLGPFSHRSEDWAGPASDVPFPLDPATITTTVDHIGRASLFTGTYRGLLRRSRDCVVLLHATALALEQRPAASAVGRLRVGCLNNRRHYVEATIFVLAAGGLENARLLLLSNDRSADGIGNAHDLVGRYFMDHLFVAAGTITPSSRTLFDAAGLYSLRHVGGSLVHGKLLLADETVRAHGLLTAAALLTPKPPAPQLEGLQALKRLYYGARAGRLAAPLRALREGLAAAPYLALTGLPMAVGQRRLLPSTHAGWAMLGNRAQRFSTFEVELQIELAPHPENRVLLTECRDPWGRPAAAARWRWSELDRFSLRRTGEIFAEELARAHLGHFQPAEPERATYDQRGVHHHMGTTRMHDDPARGVVDARLRVHGVDNLFVLGGSVFPTGGYANPTLTIVALAIRLADEIRRRMKPPQVGTPRLSAAEAASA